MQKFERITRDTQNMAGQAYVLGTGVSVYAIASLAAQGVSTAEILARYPQLDEEDLLQALAYTMHELTHVIDQRYYGIKTWLTVIQSGCQIIEDVDIFSGEGVKTERDRALVAEVIGEMFPQAIRRSLDQLHRLFEWTNFYRNPALGDPEWWPEDLARVIRQAVNYHVPESERAGVVVDLPADLPLVKVAHDIDRALGYLLMQSHTGGAFAWRITAQVTEAQTVRVSIYHDPAQGYDHVWSDGELKPARGHPQLANLFFPGTPYAIAALILNHYGCPLEPTVTDDHIEISVTLPLWSPG